MTIQEQRKNTLQLKQELADLLGDSGKEYWQQLSDFLNNKCTKRALYQISNFSDETALAVFTTPQQAKIHNKLILCILYNLSPHLPPPVGEDTDFVIKNPNKRKPHDLLVGRHVKKMFNTKSILALSQDERSRILNLKAQKQESAQHVYPKGIDGIPKTCQEEGDIPTHEALRTRMKFISAFQGLDGSFSNDAVLLLNQALDNYLKNLLSNMLQKTRPILNDSFQDSENKRKLDVNHLSFSIEMTPQKLDADLVEAIVP
ncbi:hypothetical protein HDV01_006139 [Terramyces sp. JEL0728]|nr:hypothetical protein HDV01_006139 [Terramyces sp. JEL0728]